MVSLNKINTDKELHITKNESTKQTCQLLLIERKSCIDPNNPANLFNQTWHKTMPNGQIRYYQIELTHDLLNLIVECRWGTYGTRRGGIKSHPVSNEEQARLLIHSITKRRIGRGYQQVNL